MKARFTAFGVDFVYLKLGNLSCWLRSASIRCLSPSVMSSPRDVTSSSPFFFCHNREMAALRRHKRPMYPGAYNGVMKSHVSMVAQTASGAHTDMWLAEFTFGPSPYSLTKRRDISACFIIASILTVRCTRSNTPEMYRPQKYVFRICSRYHMTIKKKSRQICTYWSAKNLNMILGCEPTSVVMPPMVEP